MHWPIRLLQALDQPVWQRLGRARWPKMAADCAQKQVFGAEHACLGHQETALHYRKL